MYPNKTDINQWSDVHSEGRIKLKYRMTRSRGVRGIPFFRREMLLCTLGVVELFPILPWPIFTTLALAIVLMPAKLKLKYPLQRPCLLLEGREICLTTPSKDATPPRWIFSCAQSPSREVQKPLRAKAIHLLLLTASSLHWSHFLTISFVLRELYHGQVA